MPIKNYRTKIEAAETVAAIAQLLLDFDMKGHTDFYTFLMDQPEGRNLLADHL